MRIICILILLIIVGLAIISRENFSKYKDNGYSFYKAWLCSTAELFTRLYPQRYRGKIVAYISKTKMKRGYRLDKEVELFLINQIALLIGGVFFVAFIILIISFISLPKGEYSNKIRRNEAGGGLKEVHLQISKEDKSKDFWLEIEPIGISEEEFEKLCDNATVYLEKVIIGHNESLENITENLVFPTEDESGLLEIEWSSDNYEIIDKRGNVNNIDVSDSIQVVITATISRDEYNAKKIFYCTVNASKDQVAKTINKLNEYEESSRDSESFEIPSYLDGAEIKIIRESREGTICKIFFLGIFIVGIITYMKYRKLEDELKARNQAFIKDYYLFINRLTLYIGAGYTLIAAFDQFLREGIKDSKLVNRYMLAEIRICLNEIKSGISEQDAYEHMGKSIGIIEYERIMNILGENVTHGSRSIISILEEEEQDAATKKKDSIRKLGEEASGKLLVPMFILLVVVIGIIVYPAVIEL